LILIDLSVCGVLLSVTAKSVPIYPVTWKRNSKEKHFVSSFKGSLYDETDVITKANIDFIKSKTSTESNPVWEALFHNFD